MAGSWRLAAGVGLVTFIVVGVVTHVGLLWLSPTWATDYQIREALKRGDAMNVLIYGRPPRAGRQATVQLANPDTLGTRAYLDLSKGPLVIEGMRPEHCTYWSASVFAHNTDVVLLRSDRDTPDRKISIGLRMADQKITEPVKDEAVLPSRTGVVLLRCFMRDREDKAYIAALTKEIHGLSMRRADARSS